MSFFNLRSRETDIWDRETAFTHWHSSSISLMAGCKPRSLELKPGFPESQLPDPSPAFSQGLRGQEVRVGNCSQVLWHGMRMSCLLGYLPDPRRPTSQRQVHRRFQLFTSITQLDFYTSQPLSKGTVWVWDSQRKEDSRLPGSVPQEIKLFHCAI